MEWNVRNVGILLTAGALTSVLFAGVSYLAGVVSTSVPAS